MHFRPEIHTESSTPVHRAWHYARGTIEAPPNANAERLLLTGIEAYIKERVDAVLRSRLATAGRGEQKSVPSEEPRAVPGYVSGASAECQRVKSLDTLRSNAPRAVIDN